MTLRLVECMKNLRRLFQFSLRTLLIVLTALGIWLGLHVQRARKQKEAVAAVRKLGGWVHYDFQESPAGSRKFDGKIEPWLPRPVVSVFGEDFFFDVVEVNLVYSNDSGKREENANFSSQALRHLTEFPKLRQLLMRKSQANDQELAVVGQLKNLEALYIWNAYNVGDKGVTHLIGLRELKTIHLDHSHITDESLRTLAALPSLEEMSLQNHRFTDKGLSYLTDKHSLRRLCVGLGGTQITDQGLIYLKGLHNLELLDLQGAKVTDAGLEHLKGMMNLKDLWLGSTEASGTALQQALPNCKIVH